MIPKNLFAVLLLALLLVSPVVAFDREITTIEDVDSYSYTPTDGNIVYEIVVDSLPFGTNQTHVLTMEGGEWQVTINTWTAWSGTEKHTEVTIIAPNGTPSTQTASTWSIFENYWTQIQPVEIEVGTISALKVNIRVGLEPAGASMSYNLPWDAQDAIAFTEVSGSFSGDETSDVLVYWTSEADFEKAIEKYDPTAWWVMYAGDIFAWSWEMVLAFLGAIPIIGPLFVSLIDIIGVVLTQGYTWALWLVVNFPAILLSVEGIIILFAIVTAGSGKNSFGKLWRNVYQYNVLFIASFIGVIMFVVNGAVTVISTIVSVVNGLKPI